MTQKNHTPGPWRVFGKMTGKVISENAPGIVEICETGDFRDAELVPFNAERWNADAYRIAAAVNACEGISTEALEAGVVKDMLEALQGLVSANNSTDGMAMRKAWDKADAAIARAIPAPTETRVQCYRGEYYKPKEHGTCIKRDGEVLWDTWEDEE